MLAQRSWRNLTMEQAEAWNEFGRTLGRYAEDDRSGPRRGYDIFVPLNAYRRLFEMPVVLDAPTEAAPAPVTGIEVLPMVQPDTFSFRVVHGLRYPADHVVFVKITPATPWNSIAPKKSSLRKIRRGVPIGVGTVGGAFAGGGPASCAPLPENGGTITFEQCGFSIDPGRCGRMRLLTDAPVTLRHESSLCRFIQQSKSKLLALHSGCAAYRPYRTSFLSAG
jgi:hypothetical protein